MILDFRRYALSTLVNNLLSFEKPVPFEFIINGQILPSSLEDYLAATGQSTETTLSLEYTKAFVPPDHVASLLHDDWVSSVDVLSSTSPVGRSEENNEAGRSGHERILSGNYDGFVRVWNISSEIIATSPLSPSASRGRGSNTGQLPVKAVKFLSSSKIISSGLDRTIRVWNLKSDDGDVMTESKASIAPMLELYGHEASIDCLAANVANGRILSASADHNVGLWSSKKADTPAAPPELLPATTATTAEKRRKLNDLTKSSTAPANTASTPPQRGALSMLKGHIAPVSAVSFHPSDQTVAYSTSWDHTLRIWDLTTTSQVDIRTTANPLLSLASLSSLSLLASGTSARHISLVDPRASATKVSVLTLRGHRNAVVSLAPDPENEYGLVSGSHDGTCRIWDVRSVKPGSRMDGGGGESTGTSGGEGQVGESVFVFGRSNADVKSQSGNVAGAETSKVLDVVWDKAVGIVSCGEDKTVQINQGNDLRGGAGVGQK